MQKTGSRQKGGKAEKKKKAHVGMALRKQLREQHKELGSMVQTSLPRPRLWSQKTAPGTEHSQEGRCLQSHTAASTVLTKPACPHPIPCHPRSQQLGSH